MVTTVPPAGLLVEGVTDVMVGRMTGVTGSWRKVIDAVCATFVTRTVTVAVPGDGEVRVAVAIPLVVVRIVVVPAVSTNVPRFVENSTAVPSATGWLFTVTVAVTVLVEETSGFGLLTVTAIVAPAGGVVPPGGGVGVGEVGVSLAHPASIAATNSMSTTGPRTLDLMISPILLSPPPQLDTTRCGLTLPRLIQVSPSGRT
jgi:hypothetical protein